MDHRAPISWFTNAGDIVYLYTMSLLYCFALLHFGEVHATDVPTIDQLSITRNATGSTLIIPPISERIYVPTIEDPVLHSANPKLEAGLFNESRESKTDIDQFIENIEAAALDYAVGKAGTIFGEDLVGKIFAEELGIGIKVLTNTFDLAGELLPYAIGETAAGVVGAFTLGFWSSDTADWDDRPNPVQGPTYFGDVTGGAGDPMTGCAFGCCGLCCDDLVCCGNPCCGDPCCGDPCCGDPCCDDPCCDDPCCEYPEDCEALTSTERSQFIQQYRSKKLLERSRLTQKNLSLIRANKTSKRIVGPFSLKKTQICPKSRARIKGKRNQRIVVPDHGISAKIQP